METIKAVLYFLIELVFNGYADNDCEKFIRVKERVTNEFHYVNSEKVIVFMTNIDDLHIFFITDKILDTKIMIDSLQNDIFILLKE